MEIRGYYINLDSAEARRRYMDGQISRLSLPIQRFAAIAGDKISENEYLRIHRKPKLHALSRPELACFLSHRECWKLIAAGNAQYGAIFEDDILFSEDSACFLGNSDWIEPNVHLIKVESTSRFIIVDRAQKTVHRRSVAGLHSRHLGAGGYIISRTLAEFLVSKTTEVFVPVDYALFDPTHSHLGEVGLFQLHPAICVQQVRSRFAFLPKDADRSHLDRERASLKKRGLGKLFRELYRPIRTTVALAAMFGNATLSGRRVILSRFESEGGM